MKEKDFVSKVLIREGWSKDKKYCVTTTSGDKYLLRISEKERKTNREKLFFLQREVEALNIPMCKAIEYGECEEGVYTLQSWIEGENAEDIIEDFSDAEQYAYGLEAGHIIKKIHSIPAPKEQPEWEERFNKKIDKKIATYHSCPITFEGADRFIAYIENNRHLLAGRPQCFQHGDYHIGNMMIEDKKLVIIDFDRYDFGDPWEEFNRIVWCAQKSPIFASGIVNGYFDNSVPYDFWKLLALYISSNMLSSIPWAISYGEGEINVMRNQAREILDWYDNMNTVIPKWYFEGYYLQYIDGFVYKIKSSFNFEFIGNYGKVFKVYDDQDSGNICFGTQKDSQKYFLKFAGAPTEQYTGTAKDAVRQLKITLPIYQDLKSEYLIELKEVKETNKGFLMVFHWAKGDCMGRMYQAAHKRFMALPVEARMDVFQVILEFLAFTHMKGYVALDFYDGSILYDFESGRTTVCDIDLFQKKPCVNTMGRMWGSSRFMSPEENELGAVIDEVTNVYTAGAFAFALFGEYQREQEHWTLSEALYSVAQKATSKNRNNRQQTIKELMDDWETAKRRR